MSAPIVPGIMCLTAMGGGLTRRTPEAECQAGGSLQVEAVSIPRCRSLFGDGAVGRYLCGYTAEKVLSSAVAKEFSLDLAAPVAPIASAAAAAAAAF
mmetsp:Transcript_49077/g.110391  ORF Transcript_49077/g.110391 Transcript_49077/m.110391 type:complete len:97 (-) Transcript_49077:81-371(-)